MFSSPGPVLVYSLTPSFASNAVVMRTGSGDFPFVCPHLVRTLSSRGLWTEDVRGYLQRSRGMSPPSTADEMLRLMPYSLGSIQLCPGVPDDLKAVYRTVWDIDPVDLIDMAADRAPFIDQSQSLTLGVRRPTPSLMVGFVPVHRRYLVVPPLVLGSPRL